MSRADRGSATAELAVGLPALVLLLITGLTAVNAMTVRMRCLDSAREAALAQARGESGLAAGQRSAPDGATITVRVDGEVARAEVTAPVPPIGGLVSGLVVTAGAVAALEPATEGAVGGAAAVGVRDGGAFTGGVGNPAREATR